MIGFTFNDIKSSNFSIVSKSVNRSLLPSMRKKEIYIPGKDGVYDFYDGTYEKRMIEVDIKYIGTSYNNLRTNARSIADWLQTRTGSKTLKFDDEPTRWYNARIFNETGLASLFKIGEASLSFECEPFAYSDYTAEYTAAFYDVDDYYDLDSFYYVFNSAYNTFDFKIGWQMYNQYNYGTISCSLTFNIVGGWNTFLKITNQATSAYITILGNVTAGSTLEIDGGNFNLELNGVNALASISDGDFIGLYPGSNDFIFEASNPTAIVTLDYTFNWL